MEQEKIKVSQEMIEAGVKALSFHGDLLDGYSLVQEVYIAMKRVEKQTACAGSAMIKKYINEDGLVGVIISQGYGAGWSTWRGNDPFFAMDKTLVEFALRKAPQHEVEQYIKTVKCEDLYLGAWDYVRVEYLAPGTRFAIVEDDGYERINLIKDIEMVA